MKGKATIFIPVIFVTVLVLWAYNTAFNKYSLSFLTVCGTGWSGIRHFLLWALVLVGLLAAGIFLVRLFSGNRCKCGCKIESGWCNCPQCGNDVQ